MSVCGFLEINFLFKAYRKVTKHGFKGRLWGMNIRTHSWDAYEHRCHALCYWDPEGQ